MHGIGICGGIGWRVRWPWPHRKSRIDGHFDGKGLMICSLQLVRRWSIPTALAALLALSSCSSNDCTSGAFGNAACTLDAYIEVPDTTLFTGEATTYRAVAVYGIGPGIPQSIIWTTTNTNVLQVKPANDFSATVTPIDSGEAYVVALINETFHDSALVHAVDQGGVRWRVSFADAVGLQPAVGADSLIRLVTGGASPMLRTIGPDGTANTPVAGCFATYGPSIGTDGVYVTGPQCTQLISFDGVSRWTAPVGNATVGIAVPTDGGAVAVSIDSVFRINATGGVTWAWPLRGTAVTAPVIAGNGDIYVGWSNGGADSVTGYASDGTPKWSKEVPGLSTATPAIVESRIIFTRPGGLFAIDTAGTVSWDRSFEDDYAPASATDASSSPVADEFGVLYLQSDGALYSYLASGTFLWGADSVGYGSAAGPIGAPAVLSTATLAVPCQVPGGREVCVVRQGDGSLVWRSAVGGGSVRGVALGDDGSVYALRTVTSGGGELVALWARAYVATGLWAVDGRNQMHTRR
jgi:hypothetical protein